MKIIQIFLLLLTYSSIFGQEVTYNHLVDPNNSETKKVMNLFENYLASNPQNKTQNPYWNSSDQQDHKHYDFLESEFQPSLYQGFPVHVLSIKNTDGLYQIKAQFSYCKNDGTPYILAIVNYFVRKENGRYKLYNALTTNRESWNCTSVGLVDFYYPPYHQFDHQKAKQLNKFINEICTNFNVQPKPFEYYLADDYDEIQKLKGLDYYIGMGGKVQPSGKSSDDKVYCGGLGEYYPHEVFHVQIDEHFPNKHFWVSEGIATLLGGSRGKSLDWHIARTNQYLKAHPEINLNDLLQLKNMDNVTSYHYVLGGLIAKKILEKGGYNLLTEFMSSGKTDDDYYNAIEKHLGIPRLKLNNYLREQLKAEAK